MKQKILLRRKRSVFELGDYAFEEKLDGSFYIFLNRKGKSKKSWNYCFDLVTAKTTNPIESKKVNSKSTKISYHSSGRINFQKDNLNEHVIYANPITKIDSPFTTCTYSIPRITKLDKYQFIPKDNDLIIEMPDDIKGRINFSFVIAPWNTLINGGLNSLSIKYNNLFSFHIIIDQNEIPLPFKLKKTVVMMKMSKGLYNNQLITEHQATLNFQHHVNKTKDLIIYSPNQEGIYKIFYAVPMRIPPNVSVEFVNPELKAEMIGKHTEAYLSFKTYTMVKTRGLERKQYVKTEQVLKGIVLEAEL